MYESVLKRCRQIAASDQLALLAGSRIGIEKESLRVGADGVIAQTPHPQVLGSALTNPRITTDFSEALTEMITPPCDSIDEALSYLADIEKFVASNIGDELLWKASMPCVVEGGDSIPIAEYGSSNIGMMKRIYRFGLGYRYGRTMQVIAGVHFNYSYGDEFWRFYQTLHGDEGDLQAFKTDHYMGLVRNVLRVGWVIPYLFGASPAVCKSFLRGKQTILSSFSDGTAYEEHATSLRMGDIGYTNSKENLTGIQANYDDIDTYVASLAYAIHKPFDEYEAIGLEVEGMRRQLSANLLQIENEYYGTVRPKQIPGDNEMPLHALQERGVEYIELRSLDINAYDPLGINREQLCFLEIFMLYCLLEDSPGLNEYEMVEVDLNMASVAHMGRKPSLMLTRDDVPVSIKEWATGLFDVMTPLAQLLDRANSTTDYSASLMALSDRVGDPSSIPSARMLNEMRDKGEEYFHFAKRMSLQHQRYFADYEASRYDASWFRELAAESTARQAEIERDDDMTFEAFLQRYLSQV